MEAYGFTGVRLLPPTVPRHVHPGDWVIDVGANVGLVTGQLCRMVGPSGRVWAFEPVPRNVSRLVELKQWNALDQLTVFAGALSSASGTATLHVPARRGVGDGDASAYASLSLPFPTSRVLDVRTWSLDDLVFDSGPARDLALLKIDVEGHERQVLDGAARTMRELRPVVLCEFNDLLLRELGYSSAQLLESFKTYGYAPAGSTPRLARRNVDLLLMTDH